MAEPPSHDPGSAAVRTLRKYVRDRRIRAMHHAGFGLDAFVAGWPTFFGGLKIASVLLTLVVGGAVLVFVFDAAPFAAVVALALVLCAVIAGASTIHDRDAHSLGVAQSELEERNQELDVLQRETKLRLELRDLAQIVADGVEPLRARFQSIPDYDLSPDVRLLQQISEGVASRLREEGFPDQIADRYRVRPDEDATVVWILNAMTAYVARLQRFAREPNWRDPSVE